MPGTLAPAQVTGRVHLEGAGTVTAMSFLDYLWDPTAWQGRRVRKMRERGETECGFRVVSGSQHGLSARWRHGTARLYPNLVEFRPGVGMGLRITSPGQPWLQLDVLEVSRLGERTSAGSESLWVSGDMPIVRVTTPTAELEWVLSREHRDWALELVRRRT